AADMDPVAIHQPVRLRQAARTPVKSRPVGRDIMQPVTAIPVADLAMLARYESLRIRQCPVEIGVAANIEAAPVNLETDRAAIRQRIDIIKAKAERHVTHSQSGVWVMATLRGAAGMVNGAG